MKFIVKPMGTAGNERPLCCDHNNDCNDCTDERCPQPDYVCSCDAICIGCIVGADS